MQNRSRILSVPHKGRVKTSLWHERDICSNCPALNRGRVQGNADYNHAGLLPPHKGSQALGINVLTVSIQWSEVLYSAQYIHSHCRIFL